MDRFEQGLKDPQEAEVVAYCANPSCEGEIYEGQAVVTYGDDLCCNFGCLAKLLGAVEMTVGE